MSKKGIGGVMISSSNPSHNTDTLGWRCTSKAPTDASWANNVNAVTGWPEAQMPGLNGDCKFPGPDLSISHCVTNMDDMAMWIWTSDVRQATGHENVCCGADITSKTQRTMKRILPKGGGPYGRDGESSGSTIAIVITVVLLVIIAISVLLIYFLLFNHTQEQLDQ
ncbi:hypothetical protein HELRODRAFT_172589 [Helobdella robusta]|uniref:Uncharacterized protein n=1 Tax=Helobdella robusta TaxID=6412 RepID=T1F5K3_HELRO|nr:hypothetical protein HELRODRAFT_172589 [Helobdella robusta]ESO04233.1 hypothetical protein HELRODRAFT_172589 [Helobdella robusta]